MNTYPDILTGPNETAAAYVAGLNAAAPEVIEPTEGDSLILYRDGTGSELLDMSQFGSTPREANNPESVTVYDAESFVKYMRRFSNPDRALVTVDEARGRMSAVLNYLNGPEDSLGWRNHRCTLALTETPDARAWHKIDGTLLSQDDFAEFIESQQPCFVDPDAATMLEISRSMRGTVNVNWQKAVSLSTGETKFQYLEDVEAKAGARGDLDVPAAFTIGLQVYEGGSRFPVTARLRYRVQSGHLAIGYALLRYADVQRAAFIEATETVREGMAAWAFINGPALA